MSPKPTYLVLSQVYVPDPASVGQHMADAAASMVRRGYRVVAIVSGRGYDNPKIKYPPRDTIDGVDVVRLPLSSFGKSSIPVRLAGAFLFLAQAFVRGLFVRNLTGILVSTSPPMCSVVAVLISLIRGVPITYWLMDLNPDQVVALGKYKEGSFPVRAFRLVNRLIWGRARTVVALDRFMADRVLKRMDIRSKLEIMPPWPHEDHLDLVRHEDNPFRAKHKLEGKFVVMYSGNHGPSNPIRTALDAATRLKHRADIVFMFIGGGIGKKEVEEAIKAGASNIVSLPYQPLADLKYSLSAADVHLVTVGDDIVGIVHPCKVYGAMAVARPVILLGPSPSHVADLLEKHDFGWHVHHGDVDAMVKAVEAAAAAPQERRESMGLRARDVIAGELSKSRLSGRFADIMERGVRIRAERPPAPAPATHAREHAEYAGSRP